MTLVLEGRVTLNCQYDAESDILYAWVGEEPRQAISYETDEGHLVRLDPETQAFLGATIFDFESRWSSGEIRLEWEVEVKSPASRRSWRPRKSKTRHAREHAVLHRLQTA